MNRTGLVVALALAAVIGVVFGVYPELDLRIAALFYDPATHSFPASSATWARHVRDLTTVIWWCLILPPVLAIPIKLIWPARKMLIPGRAVILMLLTLLLSPGLLSNAIFKSHWGRPRPVAVTEFGGKLPFVPWWDPRGHCPRNCSFFSGESATAFWSYAPAALTPPPWRPLAYVAATAFGVATGLLRMSFGGHFFTDVAAGGLVSFIVVWLVYGWLYRRATRRFSDEAIDAALTRIAWPGHCALVRLFGRNPARLPHGRGDPQTPA